MQMCGCALVCTDPPCCLGLQDKHDTHQVLGGNGVEPLHGDDPQQTSACPLPRIMMLATTLGYLCAVHCEAQAATQWGIEAEAILQSSLHHTQVVWGGGGDGAENRQQRTVSWG